MRGRRERRGERGRSERRGEREEEDEGEEEREEKGEEGEEGEKRRVISTLPNQCCMLYCLQVPGGACKVQRCVRLLVPLVDLSPSLSPSCRSICSTAVTYITALHRQTQ